MVPAASSPGQSFKGAAFYFLHDKADPGQEHPQTAERVSWTLTLNLPTDDPDQAWRVMAFTAANQHELKRGAGIKATGRKLEKPVLAYSLSWHPDEKPARDEMIDAARASLQALGLSEHQALLIAHTDEPHPHVHILANRVHPATGRAATLSKSHLILSAWAQAYEEARGRVYCEARVENNARRRGQRPGRASENRSRRRTRPEYEAAGRDRGAADERRRENAEAFRARAGAEQHGGRRRRQESDELHRRHREGREAVNDRYRAASRGDPIEAARLAALFAQGEYAAILDELTRQRSTFTRAHLLRMIGRHTPDEAAFSAALQAIEALPDLVTVSRSRNGAERYTTAAQQALEQCMARHAAQLHRRQAPPVPPKREGVHLSADQDKALQHVLASPGLAAIVGFAGTGKSTLLAAAKASWEAAGYRVIGTALSSIAADGLAAGAGIDSRTIHSLLYQWEHGQNRLTARDVLVIDEAGMIGSRQMERLLDHARAAGAKIVLAGDSEQLQAIEAGGAFRAIVNQVGAARLKTVRRQRADWQRAATVELATAKTKAALDRYDQAGMVHRHATDAAARAALIADWSRHRADHPAQSQIILAYTRQDVRTLNDMARARMRDEGGLGPDVTLRTGQGPRAFAAGDRIYFLRNDTRLGVSNGSLGAIERLDAESVTVRLDGAGRRVTIRLDRYSAIDHGYAATIHKSQGVTVDRAHVLASRNLDRHAAYVAMTRHRDRLDLHWSAETFGTRQALDRSLSRRNLKDTTLDYAAADRAAREEAMHDARQRTDRRAANFAQRERSHMGRMANARTLAGANASLSDIARLMANGRRRKFLFQKQQGSLKRWARAATMRAFLAQPLRQDMTRDRAEALRAHAASYAPKFDAMRAQHHAEQAAERTARRAAQREARQGWEAVRAQSPLYQAAFQAAATPGPAEALQPAAPKPQPS